MQSNREVNTAFLEGEVDPVLTDEDVSDGEDAGPMMNDVATVCTEVESSAYHHSERSCCMMAFLACVHRFSRKPEPSSPQQRRALSFAVFNTTNAAVGSGVLAFPFAFKQAGFAVALAISLVLASCLFWTLTILLRCSRQYHCRSYQNLVGKMIGPRADTAMQVATVVFSFFSAVSYFLVAESMLSPFVEDHLPGGKSTCAAILIGGMATVLTPVNFVRNLEWLGPTSFLVLMSVLLVEGIVCYHGVHSPATDSRVKAKAASGTLSTLQTIPICNFAMMCHITAIPATHSLREHFPSITHKGKTEYRTLLFVIACTILICLGIYIPTGVIGYRLFGSAVDSDVLASFGKADSTGRVIPVTPEVKVARICILCAVLFSYPIMVFIQRMAVSDIIDTIQARTHGTAKREGEMSTKRHVILTVLFVSLSAAFSVLSISVGLDLGFVVSIVGSTAVVSIQYIFPGMMQHKMGMRYDSRKMRWEGCFLIGMGVTMGALGLFVTITGKLCDSSSSDFCSKFNGN